MPSEFPLRQRRCRVPYLFSADVCQILVAFDKTHESGYTLWEDYPKWGASMRAKVINISLPAELLEDIDQFAHSEKRSRSELLREAARQYIENRRWRRIRDLGARTARNLRLSEQDIERIIAEYRSGA